MALPLLAALVGLAMWWMRPPPAPPRVDWRLRAGVLAGTGDSTSRDGTAETAGFEEPAGLARRADGTLLVADGDRLRAIAPTGVVSTVAGDAPGFRDGVGRAARFSTLTGLVVAADGAAIVSDTGNHALRRIDGTGGVTTLAGTGRPGLVDGPAGAAAFDGPMGLALDGQGRLFVADAYNDAIRLVAPDGLVTTVAGGQGPGFADGVGSLARFDTPTAIAVHPSGDLIVADSGNGVLRRVEPDTGRVTTLPLAGVALSVPVAVVATDAGVVFVVDERGAVVRRAPDGTGQVVAGGAGQGFATGLGSAARFTRPSGLAWLAPDRLVLADGGNALVRLLSDPLVPSLAPPASPWIAPRFDAGRFRLLPLLWPVAPFDGPHEVAGTHGERRGVDGAERFHTGVDIRMPRGTSVHAVRPGRVSSPLGNGGVGTINEWLRIGEVTYVHILAGRGPGDRSLDARRFAATVGPDGRLARLRVRRGARFATGEQVGTVNAFNHVHLAVGRPGDDHNPLDLRLLRFEDRIAPTIAPGGIRLYTAAGQPLDVSRDGRVLVHGRVQIVVDAWDQADGNVPWRRLGLHTLGYQLLHPDGSSAPGFEQPRITQRFDRLGTDSDAPRLVYAPGSGIPAYGSRRTRFLYVVTSSLADGTASWGAWDTRLLPPGDYVVRVHAADIAGNVALARRDLPVTVLGW